MTRGQGQAADKRRAGCPADKRKAGCPADCLSRVSVRNMCNKKKSFRANVSHFLLQEIRIK